MQWSLACLVAISAGRCRAMSELQCTVIFTPCTHALATLPNLQSKLDRMCLIRRPLRSGGGVSQNRVFPPPHTSELLEHGKLLFHGLHPVHAHPLPGAWQTRAPTRALTHTPATFQGPAPAFPHPPTNPTPCPHLSTPGAWWAPAHAQTALTMGDCPGATPPSHSWSLVSMPPHLSIPEPR